MRFHFKMKAISCYIMAGVFFILFLICGVATGLTLAIASAFLIPTILLFSGYYYQSKVKEDEINEKNKDDTIQRLQQEVDELKNSQKNNTDKETDNAQNGGDDNNS